jgi:hypothetical protein
MIYNTFPASVHVSYIERWNTGVMIHKGNRTKGGTMSADLQSKVDSLLDEFAAKVNEISDARSLQRGMARASLPCSMVVVMDKASLFILGQLRAENLSSMYLHEPELEFSSDKALSAAGWQFKFEDPFLIKFPASMLDLSTEERASEVLRLAEGHVDAEFRRFTGLLSLMRTRPIFGSAPFLMDELSIVILSPAGEEAAKRFDAIRMALSDEKLVVKRVTGVRKSKISIRQSWLSIAESRLVLADLSGLDPDVMYGLGIAHTVGKETVVIHPNGEERPVELPKTEVLAYDGGPEGTAALALEVKRRVLSHLAAIGM